MKYRLRLRLSQGQCVREGITQGPDHTQPHPLIYETGHKLEGDDQEPGVVVIQTTDGAIGQGEEACQIQLPRPRRSPRAMPGTRRVDRRYTPPPPGGQ